MKNVNGTRPGSPSSPPCAAQGGDQAVTRHVRKTPAPPIFIFHFSFFIFHSPAPRRGVAYLIVLAVTMIVATLGMGALLAIRAQARTTNPMGDIAEARLYALSA